MTEQPAADRERKQRVARLVEQMAMADEVIDAYRRKKAGADGVPDWEPPGFMEILLATQLVNQTRMADRMDGAAAAGALSPDAILKHLEQFREQVKAELKQWLIQDVIPEMAKRVIESIPAAPPAPPQPVAQPVALIPAEVHAAFEDMLLRYRVDKVEAKKVIELLLSTEDGNKMLQLMLHDAVIIKRKRAARGGGG